MSILNISARDNIPASTARNLAACLQRVFVGHQIYEDSVRDSFKFCVHIRILLLMAPTIDAGGGFLCEGDAVAVYGEIYGRS